MTWVAIRGSTPRAEQVVQSRVLSDSSIELCDRTRDGVGHDGEWLAVGVGRPARRG